MVSDCVFNGFSVCASVCVLVSLCVPSAFSLPIFGLVLFILLLFWLFIYLLIIIFTNACLYVNKIERKGVDLGE